MATVGVKGLMLMLHNCALHPQRDYITFYVKKQ